MLAPAWFMVVTLIAAVLVFKVGFIFALCFLGTAWLPCIAVAGARWGFLAGDKQQRIGVPLIAFAILTFAYWLSTYVSVTAFSVHLGGLTLLVISSIIGLIGVPLAWGGQVSNRG
jgi:hypothetical protein